MSNKNMAGGDSKRLEIPSELQAVAQTFVPRPAGIKVVDVSVTLGQPFEDYLKSWLRHADAIVLSHGGTFLVTEDDFSWYIRTLIRSRVRWVRGQRTAIRPESRLAIPTVVCLLLAGIGRVELHDVGVHWWPSLADDSDITQADLLRATRITTDLEILKEYGYSLSLGYEKDKRGAFDLMVQHHDPEGDEGDGVYSHSREASKELTPAAYLLGLRQLTTLLGSRVIYADAMSCEVALARLVVI